MEFDPHERLAALVCIGAVGLVFFWAVFYYF